MTPCEQLSDRMPALASSRAEWAPAERAHLQGCAECQREWELVSTTRHLGASVGEALDADAIAARVMQRLRTEAVRERHQRRWFAGGIAAAASVILALAVRQPARPSAMPAPVDVGALSIPLPELDSLGAGELESVLQSLDQTPAETATPAEPQGLGDLDTTELERVLRSLEG
jgi:anti-sigma factor RsiW